MARFADDDVARVRDRADIEAIVGAHVDLKRAGSDSLKGLCPFHDERTPSFHITPSKGVFYCHGCNVGGDAIAFIQRVENMAFPEAVRSLAAQLGVTLTETDTSRVDTSQRTRMLAVLDLTHRYFTDQLNTPAAALAREELTNRGFTQDHATDAGCGYAPTDGTLLTWLHDHGYPIKDAVAAGVAREGARGVRPFFSGRLTWPVRDVTGRVVGFGARRISPSDPIDAKYVNSPESQLYRKSHLLFGWDAARRAATAARRVIIVEGYTDVMAARAVGINEAVATCGTAFGEDHLRLLVRALPEDTRIVFCLDGDKAGVAATARAWSRSVTVLNRAYGVRLPDGHDPCSLRQAHGDQALRDELSHAEPLTRLVLSDTVTHVVGDTPTPEALSQAVSGVRDLLGQVPDPVLAGGYAQEAARLLNVPLSVFSQGRPAAGSTPSTGPAAASTYGTLERQILAALVESPTVAARWLGWFTPDLFATATGRSVASLLAGVAEQGTDCDERQWSVRLLDAATGEGMTAVVAALLTAPPRPLRDDFLAAARPRLIEHAAEARVAELTARAEAAAPGPDQDALTDELAVALDQLAALRSSDLDEGS